MKINDYTIGFQVSGMVNISDSVAYVPQQPWMQNASLRYNIIFGTKFDQTVYDTVVDSCAMRPGKVHTGVK